MNHYGVAILICLFQCVSVSFAAQCTKNCAGYKITVKDENVKCGTSNRVTLSKNITAVLSADCKLTVAICLNVTKPFKSATVDYTITKGLPIVTASKRELCEVMAELGLAGNYPCPVEVAGVYCNLPDKPIDLCKYADFLPLAVGDATGSVDVYFDREKKSDTFNVKVNIAKVK